MKDSMLNIEQAAKCLAAREPIFHQPEFGTLREDVDAMTTVGFWEVGASGREYSRSVILEL